MDVKQDDFDREHWRHPTALKGLRLRLTYRAYGQEHEVAHAELWARRRTRKLQEETVAVREAFEESESGEEAAHAL